MISLTFQDILFLEVSIFRQLTCGSVLLVILDVFDSFLNFRSRTLFLGGFIYSRGDQSPEATSGRLRFQHLAEFKYDVASTWHQEECRIFQGKSNKVNKKLNKVKRWCIG
jgi:hypothetical protein